MKAIRRRPPLYHHPIGLIITAGANHKAFFYRGCTERVHPEWGNGEGENTWYRGWLQQQLRLKHYVANGMGVAISFPHSFFLRLAISLPPMPLLPPPPTNKCYQPFIRVSFAGMESVSLIRIPMVITRSDRTGMLWFFTSVRKNSCKFVKIYKNFSFPQWIRFRVKCLVMFAFLNFVSPYVELKKKSRIKNH